MDNTEPHILEIAKSEYGDTGNIENSRRRILIFIRDRIKENDFSIAEELESLSSFKKLLKKPKFTSDRKDNINKIFTIGDVEKYAVELEKCFSKKNLSNVIHEFNRLKCEQTDQGKEEKKTDIRVFPGDEDDHLEKAIGEKDILMIRTIILNYIDTDVNREFYFSKKIVQKIESLPLKKSFSFFETDDNAFEPPDEPNWNKSLWQTLKVEMRYNFSREKFDLILEIMHYLRQKNVPFFQTRITNFTKNQMT